MSKTTKKRLSKAHREAISRGQIKRHRRAREQATAEPTHKRCSQCKKMLALRNPDGSTNFSMRKRKLASGEVRIYPAGECKECGRERRREWLEKKRRELGSEGLRELYRRWNSSRDPEQRSRYQREYQAIQRRKAGAKPRGPWKRYREDDRGTSLPREPIAAWIKQNYRDSERGYKLLAEQTGMSEKRIRSLVKGTGDVPIDIIDRILLAADAQDQFNEIYPM